MPSVFAGPDVGILPVDPTLQMLDTPAAHRRPLAGSPSDIWNPVGKALDARREAEGVSALVAVARKRLTADATVARKTAWRHSNVAIPG